MPIEVDQPFSIPVDIGSSKVIRGGRFMRSYAILLSSLALFAGAGPVLAQPGPPAALLSSCEGCHGANGQTRSPETPRLNGQTREYLLARLKDLRNPGNQTISAIHNMLDPARSVTEAQMQALAAHFAAQTPAEPNQSGAARDRGARLYSQGRADVPACASCHGDKGQGVGEAARLAGQHSRYLEDQINAMMLAARVQGDMNKHVWTLMPADARDLAAYLGNN
jgi:cytochrome c553